jgi:Fe-S oxidoreductase
MKYKLPALILEDIEMDVGEIQCSGSAITVEFADQETLKIARKSWDDISEFLIISSHAGCNENGERAPHLLVLVSIRSRVFADEMVASPRLRMVKTCQL